MVVIDLTLNIIMINSSRASMLRDRSSMTWNQKMIENPLDSTVPWLGVIGFERPLLVRLLDLESNRTKSPTWFQGRSYNVLRSTLVLLLLWWASLGMVVLEYRLSLLQYLQVLDRYPHYIIFLILEIKTNVRMWRRFPIFIENCFHFIRTGFYYYKKAA